MYLYLYILFLPTQALLNINLSLILFYLFVVRAIKCWQVTKRKKWKNCTVQIIFYRPTSKFLFNITFSPHGFFFLLFGTSSSVLCIGLWNVMADYIYLVIWETIFHRMYVLWNKKTTIQWLFMVDTNLLGIMWQWWIVCMF